MKYNNITRSRIGKQYLACTEYEVEGGRIEFDAEINNKQLWLSNCGKLESFLKRNKYGILSANNVWNADGTKVEMHIEFERVPNVKRLASSVRKIMGEVE